MSRHATLTGEITIQQVRIQMYAALPYNRVRYGIDGYFEKITFSNLRAIRCSRHQVTQINMAFDAIVKFKPKHVIAFRAQFSDDAQPSPAATVTAALQTVGHG